MRADVIVGAAFGAGGERSAIVVVQRVETLTGGFDQRRSRWRSQVAYHVPRLERSARGARYPELADLLARLHGEIAQIKPQRSTLVVDVGETGRPVLTLLRRRGLNPVPVALAETQAARPARGVMQLPRRELMSGLSILLSEQRLKVAGELAEADAMVRSLLAFRLKPAAPDVWHEGEGEDLVRAAGIACWWGERRLRSLVRQPPPPRTAPEVPPPLTVEQAIKRQRGKRPARVRI